MASNRETVSFCLSFSSVSLLDSPRSVTWDTRSMIGSSTSSWSTCQKVLQVGRIEWDVFFFWLKIHSHRHSRESARLSQLFFWCVQDHWEATTYFLNCVHDDWLATYHHPGTLKDKIDEFGAFQEEMSHIHIVPISLLWSTWCFFTPVFWVAPASLKEWYM